MSGERQWRGDWLKSFPDNPATSAVAERLYRDKPEDLQAIRAFADVLDKFRYAGARQAASAWQ